jgi:hypothetical protein
MVEEVAASSETTAVLLGRTHGPLRAKRTVPLGGTRGPSPAKRTVLLGGTRGLCASIPGVPSAEGFGIGKRRDPGSAGGARPLAVRMHA